MPIAVLLAWRFLRGGQSEKNISVMIKICFLSILIGTFALTLVVAIMNGFEKATHEKLQGIHADIVMRSNNQALDADKIKHVIAQEFSDAIAAVSPLGTNQVLIQARHADKDMTGTALVQGIDPESYPQVSAFKSMLIEPKNITNWGQLLENNSIFIGITLAQALNTKLGDSINILLPDEISSNKVSLSSQACKITGIFKTGISEFDEHMIICSLEFFEQLFDTGVTQITAKLKPRASERKTIQKLKERFSLQVLSWKDLYPPLVAALMLEKYAMFFILTLVTLVASLNSMALLFMYVTQKKHQIAVLKAMGMSRNTIAAIFIILGLIIATIASFMGIIGALVAGWLLNTYPIIKLPDIYMVTHLPAYIDTPVIILIVVTVLILSFLSTLLPARSASAIKVVQVLKSE